MYSYLYCMILSHISLQIYFENFSSPEKFPFYILFQAWRSTGRSTGFIPGQAGRPTGRPRPVSRTCTFVHVCRSTNRSTDLKQLALCFLSVDWPKTACSLFFIGRPTGRPSVVCPLRPVDRVQRLYAKMGYRSTGRSTDSLPWAPIALSSLVIF